LLKILSLLITLAPAPLVPFHQEIDADGDGFVSLNEFKIHHAADADSNAQDAGGAPAVTQDTRVPGSAEL